MSITDTPTESPAKKKAPKKRKARKARVAVQKPAPAAATPEEYAGLTVADCCKACNIDRCAISHAAYCAHPRKGGIRGDDMHNAAAIERYQKAQKALARNDADKRFS